jgi:hypothetical protein
MKSQPEIEARLESRYAARRNLVEAFNNCVPRWGSPLWAEYERSARRSDLATKIEFQDMAIAELSWVLGSPGQP